MSQLAIPRAWNTRVQSAILQARVEPIETCDYRTPAARPAYSVLDNAKLRTTFGIRLPDWEQALALALADQVAG